MKPFLLVLNAATALAATALLFVAIGVSPVTAFATLAAGAFGDRDAIGYTLFYTTDFMLAGLAVALPYRAGLFNIGAEGQIMLGGIATALVCGRMAPDVSALMVLPLAVVAAVLAGALWAAIPAVLEARRGGSVVITTIMLNFLGAAISTWLLVDVIRAPGDPSPETAPFVSAASLPGLLADTPLNPMFPAAIVLACLAWAGLEFTVWGFQLRVIGESPRAARYAGIPIGRASVAAMCIGGACAGLMAINEVLGAEHRLVLGFSAGFGFIGIAVALTAQCRPLGVIVSSLLFGALYQGGTELALDTPKVSADVIMAINGLAVLICGALQNLWRRPVQRLLARFGARSGAG